MNADSQSSRMPLDSVRRSDNGIRVTREIPLVWLVGGVIAFAAQGIAVYYQQQRQGELLQNQSSDIKILSIKVDTLIDKRNDDIVKDIQRDAKVERQGDRISTLEDKLTKGNR